MARSPDPRQIARDISYASSGSGPVERAVIRLVENATGRIGLIRRAEGYEAEVSAGADFWQVMLRRYGLRLEVVGGTLENVPKDGPLIVVANHPFGILDGLMMGHILAETRREFRILANNVFQKARDLDRVILPISFDETRAARATNIETRRKALEFLGQGGAIGVFPGGTVATGARFGAPPLDPAWSRFTARMIARSDAQVVPIFFQGRTSAIFQLASHLHMALRLGLLIRQFRNHVDGPVRVVIGEPLPPDALAQRQKDPRKMMDFLRRATYELSPTPVESGRYGRAF